MSEAALSLMQGRLLEGMRHKARRGARLHPPPRGDVRGPDSDSQMAPDEQAQRGSRVIFETFAEQGSLQGWRRSLGAHDSCLPIRFPYGPNRGPLVWRRPTRLPLPNRCPPLYAGASRWGYRQRDPRQQQPGRRSTGRTINALRPARGGASIACPPISGGSSVARANRAWRPTAPSLKREALSAKGPLDWRACACVGAAGGA